MHVKVVEVVAVSGETVEVVVVLEETVAVEVALEEIVVVGVQDLAVEVGRDVFFSEVLVRMNVKEIFLAVGNVQHKKVANAAHVLERIGKEALAVVSQAGVRVAASYVDETNVTNTEKTMDMEKIEIKEILFLTTIDHWRIYCLWISLILIFCFFIFQGNQNVFLSQLYIWMLSSKY